MIFLQKLITLLDIFLLITLVSSLSILVVDLTQTPNFSESNDIYPLTSGISYIATYSNSTNSYTVLKIYPDF